MLRRSRTRAKHGFASASASIGSRDDADKMVETLRNEGKLSEGVCRDQVNRRSWAMNIREAIEKLVNRIELSEAETDRRDEPNHDR